MLSTRLLCMALLIKGQIEYCKVHGAIMGQVHYLGKELSMEKFSNDTVLIVTSVPVSLQ